MNMPDPTPENYSLQRLSHMLKLAYAPLYDAARIVQHADENKHDAVLLEKIVDDILRAELILAETIDNMMGAHGLNGDRSGGKRRRRGQPPCLDEDAEAKAAGIGSPWVEEIPAEAP